MKYLAFFNSVNRKFLPKTNGIFCCGRKKINSRFDYRKQGIYDDVYICATPQKNLFVLLYVYINIRDMKLNKSSFGYLVDEELQKEELPEAHVLLARLAIGFDLRLPNRLKELVDDAGEDGPSDAQWEEIRRCADLEESTHNRVDLDTSTDALKQIIKYSYAVPKDTVKIQGALAVGVVPLTADDIAKFEDWFDELF